MHWKRCVAVAGLLLSNLAYAVPVNGSYGASSYVGSTEKADAVREAFRHAWGGYKQYAFPHDELRPVSNGFGDSRNGWGASAIDALSTAIIMGEVDIVNDIVQWVPSIDFSKTTGTVSLFETTIRYLGGLVSAYDLLGPGGPRAYMLKKGVSPKPLLDQATKLADHLKYAFKSPSGVPYNDLVFPNTAYDSQSNGLATVGTLVLEWTRLSDLTRNPEYGALAQKAEDFLLDPKPAKNQPFPGLMGTQISIQNGEIMTNSGSWSGGDDSFYEYLIKMFVYDPVRFKKYGERFVLAADSAMKYLRSEPKQGTVFLAAFSGTTPQNVSQHLTCFDGGTFILGGLVMKRQDYIKFGLDLANGCHETYLATATGIGPDSFGWDKNQVPRDQQDFFNKHGFYLLNKNYYLRPEVIESFYYSYRATSNTMYQDWAWEAFKNINRTTRTPTGFSEIENVNDPDGGAKRDNQESFFFAEVLKYSYLIHAKEDEWQIGGPGKPQKWVFNTEAHPVRVGLAHM